MVNQLFFATLLASSVSGLTIRAGGCCFSINVNGGPGGSVQQYTDGQCRLGQSGLTPSQFCLGDDGGLTDGQGRGCIITSSNQLQCDTGKAAQSGFAVGCDGTLSLDGNSGFTTCPTGQDGGYNIYTKAPDGQQGCADVSLHAPDASCKKDCPKPPPPPPPAKSCPTTLVGDWEYPHYIVPIHSDNKDQAYGTQYTGTTSSSISSIFNFDIPSSATGKTCSLIFLFPTQDQLTTSSYSFAGDGKVDFQQLSAPASEGTTYANQPAPQQGSQKSELTVAPGHSYAVSDMTPCPAGERISFMMSSPSGTSLTWFQDYNPSPIGLYITIC